MPIYTPEKGDFIIATFDPQSGHEQKGRRPALVISNSMFNKATELPLYVRLLILTVAFLFILAFQKNRH